MDMSTNKQLRPFGMRDKVGYAFGDFGCNMSFAFINSYLMLFYVTCMKIDPKHFAILILLGKIFDAINDPIIGGLCDATKPGKDGKFKPWIKWASPVLLLSSIALFIYAPSAPYGVKIAMCLGIYCLWSVAYTSVNVPYGSMQSCITNDPAGRSSLSQWRSIGAMCAQIPIMILLPLLVYDKNDNPRGELFIIFVGVMGAIGLVSFYLLRRMTTERIAAAQPLEKQKFNYFATLGSFFKNKPMMGVTISTVAYLALMMTVTTSMPYIFMCYFQNTKLITIATMLAGCPVALGILLVKPMLKKFTKKQLCTYPFVLSAISAGVAAFVRIRNPYVWIVLVAIAAISLLVGGIGIMNIMLVSVTERTREIGIRKSLGAKQKDIRGQFVIEAGTTSAVGGVLGIVFGLLLARAATIAVGAIMSNSMNGITFSAVPTLSDIAVSFGVSVGIGVLFGYLPANKAAKLNPIDALRYD